MRGGAPIWIRGITLLAGVGLALGVFMTLQPSPARWSNSSSVAAPASPQPIVTVPPAVPLPLVDADLPVEDDEIRVYAMFPMAGRSPEIEQAPLNSPDPSNEPPRASWRLSEVIRLSPRIQLGGYWQGAEGWNVLFRYEETPRLVVARVGETVPALRLFLEKFAPGSPANPQASAVLRDEASGQRLVVGSGEHEDDSLLAIIDVTEAAMDELPVAVNESFFVGDAEFRVTRIEETPSRVWAVQILESGDAEPEPMVAGQLFEFNGSSH